MLGVGGRARREFAEHLGLPLIQPRLLHDESSRLAALHATRLLDTLPEAAFDDVARLAAHACGAPIALVALVDAERVWVKARFGSELVETPRAGALCARVVLAPEEPLVVADLANDERFRAAPSAGGEPGARFYAGVALLDADGYALGALCVLDREPRELEPQRLELLRALARQVTQLLELRRTQVDNTRLAERAADLELEGRRAAARGRLLHDLLAEHARTRDPRAIVEGVLARLRDACPGMSAAYATLSRTGLLEHVASAMSWKEAGERVPTLDLLDAPDYFAQLRSGEPVTVRDVERDAGPLVLLEARRASGARAVLELAIQPADDATGVLGLSAPRVHLWWPHEIELLREAALALETLLWHAQHATRAEASLRELATREERWRRTCDARGIGAIDWSVASGELHVSERGAAILGLETEELRTTNDAWCARLHPHDRAAWLALALRERSGIDAPRVLELRVRGVSDVFQVVRASVRCVRDALGDTVRVVGSIEPGAKRELPPR